MLDPIIGACRYCLPSAIAWTVAMSGYCCDAVRLVAAIVSMENDVVAVRGERCNAWREPKSDPAILVHVNMAGDEENLE